MPRFTLVTFHPETGFPDRLVGWPDGHPVVDAFMRSARCVAELYSQALPELEVEGYRSSLRLSPGDRIDDADRDSVRVDVWSGVPYELPSEMGFVGLIADTGLLDAWDRARLALDVVHTAVLQLASHRRWDPAPFEECWDHVVSHDYEYSWTSPWKASPDRRHRARCAYRLGPQDGYGRVRLEIGGRRSDEVVARSGEAIAFCTSPGFVRSADTLRWSGSGSVAMAPYGGLGPPSGLVRGEVEDGEGWTFEVRDDVTARAPAGEGVTSGPSEVPVPRVVTGRG